MVPRFAAWDDALKTQTKRPGRWALREVAAAGRSDRQHSVLRPRHGPESRSAECPVALGRNPASAEIDVTSLTPDEAGQPARGVAPPDAYRIAGVDYNPVLPATSVTLQRRADGTPYLRITSDRAVQEPFVDVILELSWSSGPTAARIHAAVRSARGGACAGVPTTPAAVAAAPAPAVAPTSRPTRAEVAASMAAEAASRAEARRAAAAPAPSGETAEATTSTSKPSRRAVAAPAPAVPQREASGGSSGSEYRVKPGDTLSRVAGRLQPSGVSLDQMLVGLYQGNAHAFAGNNMNRLRSGSVLTVPTAEQAGAIDAKEARRLIQAQSADFNAYRHRLAAAVPEQATRASESTRKSTGQVGAPRWSTADPLPRRSPIVADRQAQGQGRWHDAGGNGRQAARRQGSVVARRRAGAQPGRPEEAAGRVQRRCADGRGQARVRRRPAGDDRQDTEKPVIDKPADKPAEKASEAASSVPKSVVVAASEPPAKAASLPDLAPPPAPPLIASAPSLPAASAPVPARPASKAPAPVEAPADEPSLIESLSENPLLLPGAGLILAILAGLGYYRLRGKNKDEAGVTSFLESRLQPDSFFGASGGQRIDTRDAAGSPSSMSYSLSQIDAIGDVDPVAEADVYLAYGRDLQAEEILKEAMRANPERLAIRTKLLEVYAKRRDTKGYELLAGELYGLTRRPGRGLGCGHRSWAARSIRTTRSTSRVASRVPVCRWSRRAGEMLGASTMPQSVVPSPSRFEPNRVPDVDLSVDPISVNGGGAEVDLDISAPAADGRHPVGVGGLHDRPGRLPGPQDAADARCRPDDQRRSQPRLRAARPARITEPTRRRRPRPAPRRSTSTACRSTST